QLLERGPSRAEVATIGGEQRGLAGVRDEEERRTFPAELLGDEIRRKQRVVLAVDVGLDVVGDEIGVGKHAVRTAAVLKAVVRNPHPDKARAQSLQPVLPILLAAGEALIV